MMQVRIRELALIAVAGGLLAFELISLNGVLPTAMQTLADRGVLGEVKAASMGAAFVPAPALAEAGSAAAYATARAVKGAARLLGARTSPNHATRQVLVVSRERGTHARVRVVTVADDAYRALCNACPSTHRAIRVRRAAEPAARPSTL